MLRKNAMVMGLEIDMAQLDLEGFIEVILCDLPAVVFSDEQVTKIHNSLPMALFCFEILLKLYESREFTRVTYFFPGSW
jgi:hypothetical protein